MAELCLTLCQHIKDVNCCAFSPNSRILASGSSDKTVRLWDISTEGKELEYSPLQGHTYHVCACSFSPFGTLLATASTDCTVWLWDTKTYEKIATFEGHRGSVRTCVFSPDSLLLASGSADETVCLWNTKTKQLVRRIEGFESSVMTCSFTPDNLYILAGVSNGEISLWEVQSGVCKAFDKEANDMGVNTCCFSPTFGSAGRYNVGKLYRGLLFDTSCNKIGFHPDWKLSFMHTENILIAYLSHSMLAISQTGNCSSLEDAP